MTWSRRLRTALTALSISLIVTTQLALAADPDQGPTNPTGFADLLPTPDLTHGDTRTLFEQYSPMVYGLDFDKGLSDTFNMVFNGYAYLVMMYIVAITRGAISVGWWLFSFTDIKPLTDATAATIGATGTQLVGWLLPSALAFGAVAAYTQRTGDRKRARSVGVGLCRGRAEHQLRAGAGHVAARRGWRPSVGCGCGDDGIVRRDGADHADPDAVARARFHRHTEGHVAEKVSRRQLAWIRRHSLVHRRVRFDRGMRAVRQGNARRRR